MFRGVVLYEGLFFFLFDAEGVLCLSYANLAGVPGKTAGVSPILALDWDTYVRDNFYALKAGHIVCTSSARPTGLVAADEGLMIFETDTDKFLVWDGSGWVPAINTGSISASWQSWTPVVDQGGVVFVAVSDAKYVRIGDTIHCRAELIIGASGVANNAVKVSLPVAPENTNIALGVPIGNGIYRYVAGTNVAFTPYIRNVDNNIIFYVGSNVNPFGVSPLHGIVLGDSLSFSVTYECV